MCGPQFNSSSYPQQTNKALESSIHSFVTPTQLSYLFYSKGT